MAAITGKIGECCVKEIRHTGEATGAITEIANISSYIAYPPGQAVGTYSKILIYFPDAFGPMWINSQLIMDWFAKQGNYLPVLLNSSLTNIDHTGFLVVSPDYLEGDYVNLHFKDPGFNMGEWLNKWADEKIERARVVTPPWVEAIKEKFGPSFKCLILTHLADLIEGNSETKYAAIGRLCSVMCDMILTCKARLLHGRVLCIGLCRTRLDLCGYVITTGADWNFHKAHPNFFRYHSPSGLVD